MKRLLIGMALSLAGVPNLAVGQTAIQPSAPTRPSEPEPVVLTIHPAGEPIPALKYRILPDRRAQLPGNAAVFYHRAIQMMKDIRIAALSGPRETGQPAPNPEFDIADWINGPLDEVPRDNAKTQLETYANALHEVELGALRQHCDWELDQRTEGIALLLPEIQEMRSLARLVALRVKLAILDGDTDEALHWLQVGYAMGRHVGEGPVLIQSLVGIAISGTMNVGLQDLIQQPGTPSLFWTLAACPRPFVDMTPALEAERFILERELPDLDELDSGPWSVEHARQFVREMQEKMASWTGQSQLAPGDGGLQGWLPRLGMAAIVAKVYPGARLGLIAEGRPEAEVDAMPTVQVAVLYSIQQYYRQRDNMYKWTELPYWQSYQGFETAADQLQACIKADNPLLAMFSLLLPAINSARMAEVRLDRQLAALQCIEAIRLYANGHDGTLPPDLEAITESPPPIDPSTNQPFEYLVDGDTATLSAPLIPGVPDIPAFAIDYKLTLGK